MTNHAVRIILTNGLVAYWDLDESSDGSGAISRADSVGSTTLTDNNTTPSGTGILSNGANLERDNSEWLLATDANAAAVDFGGNQSFTFAGWFKFESASQDMTLLAKYNTSSDQRAYWLRYDDSETGTELRWLVSGDGISATTCTNTSIGADVTTGQWYFVVAWHDAENDQLGLSVNNGTPDTVAHSAGIKNSSATFFLGAVATGTTGFDGIIDEVGAWNRVLTSTERTALYNSGAGKTYPF
jgi:hypothetical protein